jgi:hypothetical protein
LSLEAAEVAELLVQVLSAEVELEVIENLQVLLQAVTR